MAGKAATKITPMTNTVHRCYDTFDSQWTPGWDKKAGAEQSMREVKKRTKMGIKMTPKGPGVATRAKRK
jgi:hypothetical protein